MSEYTTYKEEEVHSYLNVMKDAGLPTGSMIALPTIDNAFENIDHVETYRFWKSWDELNVHPEKGQSSVD